MTWGGDWGQPWGGELEAYDYNALFTSKLWKQLDYSRNIRKLILDVYAAGYTEIDAVTTAYINSVGIDGSDGIELESWGGIIGQPRDGMSDDLYRRAIKASYRKAIGEGDIQTYYDVLRLFAPTASMTLMESFPACVFMWVHNLTSDEQEEVAAIMQGVPGLGICCQMSIVDPAGVFQWASTTGSVTVTRHWSSTTGSVPSSQSAGFASVRVIQ